MLVESQIQTILREYLIKKGWKLTNLSKNVGEHGCDIIASHYKWGKRLFVEIKGGGKAEIQMKHNGFYTLIGQILSRMDIGGNNYNKARIYAIAIPAHWEKTFTRKIKRMVYGWKLLKLKVFLVSLDNVEEKSYSYFLKNNI